MDLWLTWDAWVIGKFEKFTHWFQQWTGKTNYFLCGLGACAVIIVEVIGSTFKFSVGQPILLPSIFIVLFFLFFLRALPALERRAFERLGKNRTANPDKINQGVLRLLFTMLLTLAIVAAPFSPFTPPAPKEVRVIWSVIAADVTLFFLIAYFFSCDPLPPCRGRVWDEIGAFFAKPIAIEKDS